MIRIWCRVSGGVTGTREAWFKENGVVREFKSRAEADAVAAHLAREFKETMAASALSLRPDVSYTVVEI